MAIDVSAVLRGAVAAMAMTGARTMTVSLGVVKQAPPQQLAGEASGLHRAAVELAHWGVGGLGAIGYDTLPRAWRRHAWTGPAFGLALWSGYEMVSRGLGIDRGAEPRPGERIAVAADHLLYGRVLDELRRTR